MFLSKLLTHQALILNVKLQSCFVTQQMNSVRNAWKPLRKIKMDWHKITEIKTKPFYHFLLSVCILYPDIYWFSTIDIIEEIVQKIKGNIKCLATSSCYSSIPCRNSTIVDFIFNIYKVDNMRIVYITIRMFTILYTICLSK